MELQKPHNPLKSLIALDHFGLLRATICALISLPTSSLAAEPLCGDYSPGESRSFDFYSRGQSIGTGPSLTTVQARHEVRAVEVGKFEIHFLLKLVERSEEQMDRMASRVRMCAEKASPYLVSPEGVRLSLIPHFSHWGEEGETTAREVHIGVAEGRNHSQGYTHNISCTTVIHELLHLTGLVDEYEELSLKNILFGATATYDCRSLGPKSSVMSHHYHGFDRANGIRKVLIQEWTCHAPKTSEQRCPPGSTHVLQFQEDRDNHQGPRWATSGCRDGKTYPPPRSNFCGQGEVPHMTRQTERNTLFRDVESAETDSSPIHSSPLGRLFGGPRTRIDTSEELISGRNLVIFDFDPPTQMDFFTEGYMIYDVKYWSNSPTILHSFFGREFVPVTRVESYKTVIFADENQQDDYQSLLHEAHVRQILYPNCTDRNPVYLTCSPNAYRTSNKQQCLEVPEICSHPTEWLK